MEATMKSSGPIFVYLYTLTGPMRLESRKRPACGAASFDFFTFKANKHIEVTLMNRN